MKYQNVFVGGTFDGLHKGHESLLLEAFRQGFEVTIGLTSDLFVQKFKIQSAGWRTKFKVRNFIDRKTNLGNWLHKTGLSERSVIISIDNPYEPAASMGGIDALVATAQTMDRAQEINRRRQKRGLASLTLIEVPMVAAFDNQPISSSRLRQGEIDTQGKLIMPESLRVTLGQPLGRLLRRQEEILSSVTSHQGQVIIAVGDATAETLLDLGIVPSLAIVDLHIARRVHDTLAKVPETLLYYSMAVASGPGFISDSAHKAIAAWATHCQPTLLIVKGEEDLLALPAILEGPEGSVVYYGQPDEGLVEVVVTPEKKSQAQELIEQFTH